MEWHPIASVFPMLEGDELQSLADDIREHGLKEPVTIFEDKVLDGRNRSAACTLAGVEPRYVTFKGTRLEAVAHVWSLNRVRRQLDSSQCAMAETRRAGLCEEYAAEIRRQESEAAARKSPGRPRTEEKESRERIPAINKDDNRVKTQRAKAAGTNRKYLDAAEKIDEQRPDLGDKVLKGELSIPQAHREMVASSSDQAKPSKPVEFDWGDGVADLRKLFDRTAKKWPANERKKFVQFWKQVADEAARNDSWLKGEE